MRRYMTPLLIGLAGIIGIAACGGEVGIPIYFQSDRDGNWEIYSIWHDGTNEARLTNNSVDDTLPMLSLDGTKLAFLRTEEGVTDLWAMNLDGTGQRNVTNGETGGKIRGMSWLADGSGFALIIAIPDVAGGNAQFYTMNEDGSNLTRISTEDDLIHIHVRVNPQGVTAGYAVSAGPDEESLDIHILDSTGRLRTIVPSETFRATADFKAPGVIDDFATYEDTGRALVFETNVNGNWDIYRVESDGRKPINITNTEFNERQPDWGGALDGFTFAYATDQDGNFEIYTFSLDRRVPTRVTNSPGQDMNPTWVKLPPED